ncbi:MAG: hypothetical protein ABSG36_00665 [Acidimicrobiales bacterium]|jgi:hypothetical protein
MSAFWLGTGLVIVAVAIGLNEVRRQRWHPRPVLIVLVVLLVVAFVPPMELRNRAQWRAEFGTFSATAAPPRVDLCGRRFYPDDETVTLTQAKDQEGRALGVVARTPAGTAILAKTSHAHVGDCILTLYVETAPDRYVVYELSGGP